MKGPTRRQWRGYAVMTLVLTVVLLVAVFKPLAEKEPPAADHSQLKEAVDSFGENIVESNEYRQKRYHSGRTRNAGWHYDSVSRFEREEKFASHREEYYRTLRVELNTADTAELQSLYGIGPTFADRIVKYRQKLGGFVRKEQLLEVYGMDSSRYEGIAGNVTVDSTYVVQIDINNATVADLKRHPYIDYYQARAIVDFRKRGKKYEEMRDLLLVSLMDEETVRKLRGYIQFN